MRPRHGGFRPFLLLLVTMCPVAVSAQIAGVVVDSAGRPVAGARVELWGRSALGVTGLSNREGRFDLPSRPSATRVLAFAMGMDSAFAQLGNLLKPVKVVLRPRPVILPGLSVDVAPLQCPRKDDAAARALWRRVVASYEPLPDTVLWAARIVRMSEGVGYPGAPMEGSSSMHGITEGGSFFGRDVPLSSVPWSEAWIRRHGYAHRVAWGGVDRRVDAWAYLPLDGRGAAHLQTRTFADLQRFGFGGSPGDRTIVLCSKDTKKPGIRGQIVINQADRVVRADMEVRDAPAGGGCRWRGRLFAERALSSAYGWHVRKADTRWPVLPTDRMVRPMVRG